MKPKTVVSAVLLTFVGASFVYLAVGQAGRGPAVVGEGGESLVSAGSAGSAGFAGDAESAGCAGSAVSAGGAAPVASAAKAGCAGCPDAAVCAGSAAKTASVASAAVSAADTGEAVRPDARVVAYYFHGTRRCPTCLSIEKTARESLERELAGAFESGAIEWRTVDYEESGNEHFAREFELTGATLVLVKEAGGQVERWANLERVWDLIGDDAEFSAYVTGEARGYLEES
jgi:hypothetical protein